MAATRLDLLLCHRFGWEGNQKTQVNTHSLLLSISRIMMSVPQNDTKPERTDDTSSGLPCGGRAGSVLQLKDFIACSSTKCGGKVESPRPYRKQGVVEKLPHSGPHKIRRWVTNSFGAAPHKAAYLTMFLGGSQGIPLKLGSGCT